MLSAKKMKKKTWSFTFSKESQLHNNQTWMVPMLKKGMTYTQDSKADPAAVEIVEQQWSQTLHCRNQRQSWGSWSDQVLLFGLGPPIRCWIYNQYAANICLVTIYLINCFQWYSVLLHRLVQRSHTFSRYKLSNGRNLRLYMMKTDT